MTRSKWLREYFIFLLLLLFCLTGLASDKKKDKDEITDWSRPEAIDPFKKGICDFLDIDLNIYLQRATLAYRKGKFKEAAQYYLYVLRHDFADERSIYNLSCCYALMGEDELAATTLIRAVNAGYTKIDHIKRDRDFRLIKEKPYFVNVMRRLDEWERSLGDVIYVPGPRLFKCRLHLPKKFDKKKSYPLVIGLHGNGGNADGFDPAWKLFGNQGFIFAAAEGPYPYMLGYKSKVKQCSWEIQIQDEELWKRADPLSVEYIKGVARYLSDLYQVSSVYLLGHSQGAGYAYITGIKNPDFIKGIMCFGGQIPPMDKSYSLLSMDDIEKGKNLRVFIAHGTNDDMLKIEHARESKRFLEQNGFDVTYVEFNGGHELNQQAMQKAADWIIN
jgi:phospholipase/carboxylesterase